MHDWVEDLIAAIGFLALAGGACGWTVIAQALLQ
jgi:hypothetical protein